MKNAIFLLLFVVAIGMDAKSNASFPENWKQWIKVKETYIPGVQTPIPQGTSPLFVDTIKSYNWINAGKGTKLAIFVNPSTLAFYKTHGPYQDGITAVAVYENSGIIFVTQHIKGAPIYGTYNFVGKDISNEHPNFAPAYCTKCHVSYQEICRNGTCAVPDTKYMNLKNIK